MRFSRAQALFGLRKRVGYAIIAREGTTMTPAPRLAKGPLNKVTLAK